MTSRPSHSNAAINVDCDGSLPTLNRSYSALFKAACESVGADGTLEMQEAYIERFFEAVGGFHPNPYRAGMAAAVGTASLDAVWDRLDADEYVYVGDSLEHDVRPARDAGFLAVHVDTGAEPGLVAVDGLDTLGELSR